MSLTFEEIFKVQSYADCNVKDIEFDAIKPVQFFIGDTVQIKAAGPSDQIVTQHKFYEIRISYKGSTSFEFKGHTMKTTIVCLSVCLRPRISIVPDNMNDNLIELLCALDVMCENETRLQKIKNSIVGFNYTESIVRKVNYTKGAFFKPMLITCHKNCSFYDEKGNSIAGRDLVGKAFEFTPIFRVKGVLCQQRSTRMSVVISGIIVTSEITDAPVRKHEKT